MTTLNSSTKLKFKRSKTAGKRPDINSIEPGELFVNLADNQFTPQTEQMLSNSARS